MGSGGSKGSAVEVGPAEQRGRMRGVSCLCFSSSSDQEKEIKEERRERNTSKCIQFMFPCHGRIIRSLSSDDEDDTESSSDSDLSTDLPSRAATIMQNSNDPPIRSGSRFCFTLTRAQSLRSSTDPSTDGNHDYDELMAGNTVRINDLPSENFERRPSRRNGFQDPFEGSVRFSRTLSVGRLRDRVLRRSSILDGSHEISDILGRRALNRAMRGAIEGNTPDDYHQSTILERRRRLRSQVWALQRLGNRVERSSNGVDEANSRSSISRIVMLAEALFEVLDEIHQQAVVLASRPSISTIGSIPAPREVVDEIPWRVFQKEEASQCYICLLEYEEGDRMRVLPCGHEFHQSCVDKWLKEIHRVCPLCRGDVCMSEVAQPEKLGL